MPYHHKYKPHHNPDGKLTLNIEIRGLDIIRNPLLNKGTAFTESERDFLGLRGVLPPHVATLEEQIQRAKENFDNKPDNIEKYIFLRSLQDRNETLFYALLQNYIHEMMPIIYTPTVGEAVQKYGHIFRNTRGLFITPENIHKIDEMLCNQPSDEVDIIVVTDNEGILGIGDQGVGGMGIPIGKLSLYTLAAGIHPSATLPISLDVGTDNEQLRKEPLYLGKKTPRLRGKEYYEFIEQFVQGIKRNYPAAILQWEDFSKANAFSLMDGYADVHPSFNDDIQGTAAVTVAGIMGALRIKEESFKEQRYLIFGAGAAGVGIARQIYTTIIEEGATEEEARKAIYMVDSRGLILNNREGLDEYKREFARVPEAIHFWELENPEKVSLLETINGAKITVLIGVSGQPDSFTDEIIKRMMKNSKQPVIFPLSNPTSLAERNPGDILRLTGGQALVATGSPFEPVQINGQTFEIGQGNNAFIFPGVGLGALLSRAKKITPAQFTAAALAVAHEVSEDRLSRRCVYPAVEEITEVSRKVALAVYEKSIEEKTGTPVDGDVMEALERRIWKPVYPQYIATD